MLSTSMSMLNDHSYFMDKFDPESDLAYFIRSKTNLPDESGLPKITTVKKTDNDVIYLLSKLSDEELIKILNTQPNKNVYGLRDIIKITIDSKAVRENSNIYNAIQVDNPETTHNLHTKNIRVISKAENNNQPKDFFKLENKESLRINNSNYFAVQKLNDLINNYQINIDTENNSMDDDKKELLFDVLVSQLKILCCKKSKDTKHNLITYFIPKEIQKKSQEYLFLIVNDEIKNSDSDEIVFVNPDSLKKNSSVLLLGPITTPLSDSQLSTVIRRISKELSKLEYIPLLQQLSDGTLNDKNKLSKRIISGAKTRRYIKPHRCNHQSKLANVYGGPKWLICTGYINLYDQHI